MRMKTLNSVVAKATSLYRNSYGTNSRKNIIVWSAFSKMLGASSRNDKAAAAVALIDICLAHMSDFGQAMWVAKATAKTTLSGKKNSVKGQISVMAMKARTVLFAKMDKLQSQMCDWSESSSIFALAKIKGNMSILDNMIEKAKEVRTVLAKKAKSALMRISNVFFGVYSTIEYLIHQAYSDLEEYRNSDGKITISEGFWNGDVKSPFWGCGSMRSFKGRVETLRRRANIACLFI